MRFLPRWGVVVCMAFVACDSGVPEFGDGNRAIVNGTVTEEYDAVPLLLLGDVGICTGALVTPRTIITAAHCLIVPPSQITAQFINFFGGPGQRIGVADFSILAGTDFAALTLDAAPEGISPIRFNQLPLEGREGAEIHLVGFGTTHEFGRDAGVKREGSATLSDVTPGGGLRTGEMATTNFIQGTCYGDSGGPNLITIAGEEYVAGVTSRGTDICGSGVDIAVRTDSHSAWLNDYIADHEEGSCAADGICVAGCADADTDCCVPDGRCEESCGELDIDCTGLIDSSDLGTDFVPTSPDGSGLAGGGGCSSGGHNGSGWLVFLMLLFALRDAALIRQVV